MTRGLGGPRVKARLAREGSRRGVLRAGRKQNVPEHGGFRPEREKIPRLVTEALTRRDDGGPCRNADPPLKRPLNDPLSFPRRSEPPGSARGDPCLTHA